MSKTQTYVYKDGSKIEAEKDSKFEFVAKLLGGIPIDKEQIKKATRK